MRLPSPLVIGLIAAAVASGAAPATRADEPRLGHRPTAWTHPDFARHRRAAMVFGDGYREFLSKHKTEREVVAAAIALAKNQGFRDLLAKGRPVARPGTRYYAVRHGKLAALVVIGQKPVGEGLHVVAAHIDSVRIDLKQNPLYGDGNAAWLQTHYYGGIKPYQWLSLPLELRGTVVKRGGAIVQLAIGDDPGEPVLVIPDLAVHMSGRVDRSEGEQVSAEALDPILATTPAARPGPVQDPFAVQAEQLLGQLYGLTPADLAAAELALVPAGPARDVGIDRALVGGYGQDDRACAYAALRALLELTRPQHTAVVMLVDREEVGSGGNTGAQSSFVRQLVAEILDAGRDTGAAAGAASQLAVDRVLAASMVFSADVIGAVHAQYPGVFEPRNDAFLGAGVVWDRSAVHAEVMGYVRDLLDRAKIHHQAATWGKAQARPAGGTILPLFQQHGMHGLDVSIPLLSMHSTFELVSKADLYEAYRAYRAFLAD